MEGNHMSSRLDFGALKEIDIERNRQILEEGWTSAHDDGHEGGEMADAAACYAAGTIFEVTRPKRLGGTSRLWPWDLTWWKPKDRRSDLIRAAALIVAEIERLDRAALREERGE
jgi:hypothetical protein